MAGKTAAGRTAARKDNARNREHESAVIGLAQNANDEEFECGTCKYFKDGACRNPNPKLNGLKVDPEWCCNLYWKDGMKVIVA